MNTQAIAIEAGNNGVGESWPEPQLDCYVKLVRALCSRYGIDPNRCHAHAEWSPGRKIDPAGPPKYAPGAQTWDMNAFRADVAGTPPTTPPPVEPVPPVNDWWSPLMQRLPVLRKGSSGTSVKRMQHLLAAAGFMDPANTANYDGKFGSGTEGALNRFKQSAGGMADGVCDPWAWGALMHTIDGIPTIKKGAHNHDVERMQHLLAANGFMNEANTANYDSQWGDGTEKAKVNFDRANGLTPSPPTDCGQKSWTKLLGG